MNFPSPRFNLWPISGDQGDAHVQALQLAGSHCALLRGDLVLLRLDAGNAPRRLEVCLLDCCAGVEQPEALDGVLRCGVCLQVNFLAAS